MSKLGEEEEGEEEEGGGISHKKSNRQRRSLYLTEEGGIMITGEKVTVSLLLRSICRNTR